MVIETEQTRQNFDLSEDPLIAQSDKVINNPENILNVTEAEEDVPLSYKTHKCQKPLTLKVSIDKVYTPRITTKTVPAQITVKVHVKDITYLGSYEIYNPMNAAQWSQRSKSMFYNSWNKRDIDGVLYDIPYNDLISVDAIASRYGGTYHFNGSMSAQFTWQNIVFGILKTVKEKVDDWTVSNPAIDELIDQSQSSLVSEEIVEGAATRNIDGLSIHAPIWRLRETYELSFKSRDSCKSLLEHNKNKCEHISTKCLTKKAGQCVLEERTYKCADKYGNLKRTVLKGDGPYCLDGSCVDTSYEHNQDMLEVLSKLSIFQEMQKDVKSRTIFTGTSKQCSKKCLGFGNCCDTMKGIAISAGLARCSQEEKELAKLRTAGKTVYIGTYCVEKAPITKTCLRKKSTYCCFGSKLVRAVQEQGRRQLGIGWGNAEKPSCRGLTVEELSRIDFGQIDLSEVFDDIQASLKEQIDKNGTTQRFTNEWQSRLPQGPKDPQDYTNANKVKDGETL